METLLSDNTGLLCLLLLTYRFAYRELGLYNKKKKKGTIVVLLNNPVVVLVCEEAQSIVSEERITYESKVKEKLVKVLIEKQLDPGSWEKYLPPNY